MLHRDNDRRWLQEIMTLALDIKSRMSWIELAAKEKPGLFDRAAVRGMREFGEEGLRQRGGGSANSASCGNPQQVSDDFVASCARVDNLCTKLKKGRFARNPLVIAGMAIRGDQGD